MSAVTASLCSTLLFVGLFVFVSADQKNITAECGQDITLPCRAPNNNIRAVEWSRADLKLEHVLLYRDDQFVKRQQHPSFKNRVDLQDRQMKDGDVSLILKNVMTADNGTYKCLVVQRDNLKLISIISLSVDPPGQTGGHTEDGGKEAGGEKSGSVGLIVGLLVPVVLLIVAVLIYRKCKKVTKHVAEL
ncbi:butyrophilin-like protein 9 isoform X2 [Oreochromis niloticus]|uniref:butyrophilin-like protein 9 isoform X2 n=1 Tax=Oreochromis niloticus TaxID=8128 RepID=UPI00090557C5|nr:butyrophilin-like protein 9 isoform X2 [Oreochromis niloticus]